MSQVYVVAHSVCDGVYAFLWRCLGFVMVVRLMLCCCFSVWPAENTVNTRPVYHAVSGLLCCFSLMTVGIPPKGNFRGDFRSQICRLKLWIIDLLADLAEVIPVIVKPGQNVSSVLMSNPIQRALCGLQGEMCLDSFVDFGTVYIVCLFT